MCYVHLVLLKTSFSQFLTLCLRDEIHLFGVRRGGGGESARSVPWTTRSSGPHTGAVGHALWTVTFAFSISHPCVSSVRDNPALCTNTDSTLWNSSSPPPAPRPQSFYPSSSPQNGCSWLWPWLCLVSLWIRPLDWTSLFWSGLDGMEWLSLHCCRQGGGSLRSCWWDGRRPSRSSGLQVDYLKYIRYLVLLAYLLCSIILKSVCLLPGLGHVMSILVSYLGLGRQGL